MKTLKLEKRTFIYPKMLSLCLFSFSLKTPKQTFHTGKQKSHDRERARHSTTRQNLLRQALMQRGGFYGQSCNTLPLLVVAPQPNSFLFN
jgi:hypothetical protein